jgi:hypothetical protein
VNEAENGRYRIRKTVISHPHQDCVLMRTHVDVSAEDARALQLFVLCAPHLEAGGWHNNAKWSTARGGRIFRDVEGTHLGRLGCTTDSVAVRADTSRSTTAGLTCTTTSRWTGRSTSSRTGTSQ